MPVNPEVHIHDLVKRMRESANKFSEFPLAANAATDLHSGANCIENLLVMGQMATDVWDIAARKGCLFVTDSVTLSDNLVGFFVPAAVMNRLGEYVVQLKAHA